MALFGWPPDVDGGWSLALSDPLEVIEARALPEVPAALARVEEAGSKGLWAALMLSYEAAPALDPDLATHDPGAMDGFPLLWVGLYRGPCRRPETLPRQSYAVGAWEPLVPREAHAAAVAAIRARIRAGDTYQANYTMPLCCAFAGHALSWFADLAARQRAPWSAFLDMGPWKVLSFSPELFFRVRDGVAEARPMKGTFPRGRWAEEDAARREALRTCPKNRAENVMIVDLLRNDLGRVAVPGSVIAGDLFSVEAYPAVHQMTSTVRARLKPDIGLADLFAALFPCGSVTGAPKVSTMRILRGLEPHPRLAYCGALGFVAPGGDCAFAVPIRTVILDTRSGEARFGVGGGVTHDSTAQGEYDECLAKMRFLEQPAEDCRLIETILAARGHLAFLDGHLARLRSSAAFLGFALDQAALLAKLEAATRALPPEPHIVRVLLARDGALTITSAPVVLAHGRRLAVGLAPRRVDSEDPLLQHKTTCRAIFDQALLSRPGCDDVLLLNEKGELTQSCRANLVLQDPAGRLLTPARECGLLPGVFRARLLARGLAAEARLTLADLARARRFWLVNSVRGWQKAVLASSLHLG